MLGISPAGLAAAPVANQLSVLATITEQLCQPFCVSSTVQPSYVVNYSVGTLRLVGNTVFAPITATVTVTVPGCGGRAKTFQYTETFDAIFQGRTTLPASVTVVSDGRVAGPACVKCGKAFAYKILDSLIITAVDAAPAAAPAVTPVV